MKRNRARAYLFVTIFFVMTLATALPLMAQEAEQATDSQSPLVYITWSNVIDDGVEQALRMIPTVLKLVEATEEECELGASIVEMLIMVGHGRGYIQVTDGGETPDTHEPLFEMSTWCDFGDQTTAFIQQWQTLLPKMPGVDGQVEELEDGVKALRIGGKKLYWGGDKKFVFSTTLRNLKRDLALARQAAADPLADDPVIKRLRDKVKADPNSARHISAYIDVPGIIAMLRKDPTNAADLPENFDNILAELGVDGIKGAFWHCDTVEGVPTSRFLIETDGSSRGILSFWHQEPLQRADLELIPRDAYWGTACNFNLSNIWQEAHRVVEVLDPNAVMQMDGAVSMASTMIGFDPLNQLLPALGDTWVVYDAPDHGGLLVTGIVLVLDINRPDEVNGAIARLVAIVKPILMQAGYDLVVGETESQGHKINYIYTPGLPIPIAPAAAYVDGRVVVGLTPQVVKTALRQADPKLRQGSVLDLPDVKRLAGEPAGKVQAFSYYDFRDSARTGYKFMHLLRIASAEMLAGPDSKYDPGKMPTLPEVLDRTTAYVGYYSVNDGDILSTEKGSLFVWDALLGSISTLPVMATGVSVLLPSLSRARELSKRAASSENLHSIGAACHIYATDHEGKFPPDWDALIHEGLIARGFLTSPRDDEEGVSYVYIEGQTEADHARNVLAYERVADEEGTNVLFVDSTVFWMQLPEFEDALRQTYERLGRPMKAPEGEYYTEESLE